MLTAAARRGLIDDRLLDAVTMARALTRDGWTAASIRAHLDAGRWQRFGQAIVLHSGQLDRQQAHDVALVNCGPAAVLTGFTAAAVHGLSGWERDWVDVLVAPHARATPVVGIDIRRHFTRRTDVTRSRGRRLHGLAGSLVVATSTFGSPRPATGLLAAAVQQRLIRASELADELTAASRTRHRRDLLLAVADIAGGAHALSEIDFTRLCRRGGLPMPIRQLVRVDSSGRRRYFDAVWQLRDGRELVVEVDGALHLAPQRWYDDQLRQNEIVLRGALVLRFPSVVVRAEPDLVINQLRRALG